MKKLIFTLLLGITTISGTMAQDATKGTLGIRAGINVANAMMKYGGLKLSPNSLTSFLIGASYQTSSSTPFGFETGLYLSGAGCEMGGTKVSATYLKIPILVNYNFAAMDEVTIQPFAGLYAAYGLFGKQKEGYYSYDVFKKDEDGYQFLKRPDAGVRLGVGAIYQHYYFGLGYDAGLLNIAKESDGNTVRTKNFFVSLGYNF